MKNEIIFRSVYLEKLPSGILIDRIMDPIYMASK